MNKKIIIIIVVVVISIILIRNSGDRRQNQPIHPNTDTEETIPVTSEDIQSPIPTTPEIPTIQPTPPDQPPTSPFVLGSGDYDFTLRHGGLDRTYTVHVPVKYDKNKATQIVMYIHGGAGNKESAYLDKVDVTSDKYGFILAIPEGVGKIERGKLRASWNGGEWKDGKCCGNADDVGFISAMIEKLKEDFNVAENKIYAMGPSNGGLMTNRLGCELSSKIAAIATVAPAAMISRCSPERPVPFMNIHGTGDRCNNYDTGGAEFAFCANVDYSRMPSRDVVDNWKNINNCKDTFVQGYKKGKASCIVYSQCSGGAEVEFCTVDDMGHVWPSGSQYLPALMVGPVSYDISTDQIWDFFERHPMN